MRSKKPSFTERVLAFGLMWALEYVIVRWTFRGPYPGMLSYFAASIWVSLFYIEKAVGAR